jgi:hypothetical protein
MAKKVDLSEFESQDFSDWEIKERPEKVVEIDGKKFLLRQPEDSDRLIRAISNPDPAKVLRDLCLEVIAAPRIDRFWDRLDFVWKMRLGEEVARYLGVTPDFLGTQRKP